MNDLELLVDALEKDIIFNKIEWIRSDDPSKVWLVAIWTETSYIVIEWSPKIHLGVACIPINTSSGPFELDEIFPSPEPAKEWILRKIEEHAKEV